VYSFLVGQLAFGKVEHGIKLSIGHDYIKEFFGGRDQIGVTVL
jgi:hypothetical protein